MDVQTPETKLELEELRKAKLQTMAARRKQLRKLLVQDYACEDCELRAIGLAYAPRYL